MPPRRRRRPTLAPRPASAPVPTTAILTYESFGEPFFLGWCTGCHSSALTGDARAGAPVGVDFDSLEGIRSRADAIWSRAADGNATMPPTGGPSAGVREELGEWLACGAPAATVPSTFDAGVDRDPPDGGQPSFDGGPTLGPPLFSDTGEYATPVSDGMAFCGPTSCDPASTACCLGQGGAECAAAPSGCDLIIRCDGPEDCPGGACCVMPSDSNAQLACASSCEMMPTICHAAEDCPSDRPICCSMGAPFGHCTTMEGAAPGERCDVR